MNIINYVEQYGQLDFNQQPFNEIDNLVLSEVVYCHWEKIIGLKPVKLAEACQKYIELDPDKDLVKMDSVEERKELVRLISTSKRFGNLLVGFYVNELEYESQKQFSALCFHISTFLYYVAFRGTDQNMVSWKEDLNMACILPISAQERAENYLRKLLLFPGKFMVGGHSKGGNLALYAAVKVNDDKIIKVYNNDGPGFIEEFVKSEEYQNVAKKTINIVPYNSVIGMLLNNNLETKVVKADAKNIIDEHNGFTWQIKDDHFEELASTSTISRLISKIVHQWYNDLTLSDKLYLVNTLYDLIVKNEIYCLSDVLGKETKLLFGIIDSLKRQDKAKKSVMFKSLLNLLKESGISIFELFKNQAIKK